MIAFLKRLAGELFSGSPDLQPMDLDRDWADVERLLIQEEWPFLRSDIEVSHRQPGATSIVARKDGAFAGFFITHAFGNTGYLDMMVIDSEFRKRSIARPLYFRTLKALKKKGIQSFVVHTTNDSSRLIRLLGFKPGGSYTLLTREPSPNTNFHGGVDLLGSSREFCWRVGACHFPGLTSASITRSALAPSGERGCSETGRAPTPNSENTTARPCPRTPRS